MATHSSILALEIPWTVQYMGSQRVRHNRVFHAESLVAACEIYFPDQGSNPGPLD